jgi:hypothetical protein
MAPAGVAFCATKPVIVAVPGVASPVGVTFTVVVSGFNKTVVEAAAAVISSASHTTMRIAVL